MPVLLVLGMAASVPPVSSGSPQDATARTPGMPGMAHAAGTAQGLARGLATEQDGYRLNAATCGVPAGRPTAFRFTVTGPDGTPVTDFTVHQTKKLHFYAIRTDLTGFQHLHPDMADDGTWTADLAALAPGTWRLYADFIPNTGPHAGELVLSHTVTVPGQVVPTPCPPRPAAPSSTATPSPCTHNQWPAHTS
ncbi:hypothetical protein ACFVXG_41735 [Kitasatospora sp. NPDC058162]|uniref:hypothetical protein n=1 Tax=Kitasatospora sp. NPDC058162 TaxID=3346362 RepID=UPI0036DF94B4